jgi:hypothetical protein
MDDDTSKENIRQASENGEPTPSSVRFTFYIFHRSFVRCFESFALFQQIQKSQTQCVEMKFKREKK